VAFDLRSYFDVFIREVSIGPPQTDRMESAARTIKTFLIEQYDIPEDAVF